MFLRLKRVEEVDELKSNILNLVRHETRTPMTGIISTAEVLLQGKNVPSDKHPLFIRTIFENARRLRMLFLRRPPAGRTRSLIGWWSGKRVRRRSLMFRAPACVKGPYRALPEP